MTTDPHAVWDHKPDDKSAKINWVELKTAAEIASPKDVVKFERKLHKFWIQSFLLGVPKIVVGFRTNDTEGRLLRVEEYETTKIPSMVRNQGQQTWDSSTCINFMSSFLQCERSPRSFVVLNTDEIGPVLKANIKGEGVWKLQRRERSPYIDVSKVEETGHGDILPVEFVTWRSCPLERKTSNAQAAVPP